MITGFAHAVQLSVFVKSVGVGYILGLLFAVIALVNILGSKKSVIVFFGDILFFVTAACFSFLFLLKFNAGIMRFYIAAGEVMGFCLFSVFPGNTAVRLFEKTHGMFKKRVNIYSAKREQRKNVKKQKKQKAVSSRRTKKRSLRKKTYSFKRKKSLKFFENT